MRNGAITNFTPANLAQYPDSRFHDPNIGPNMHQVNKGLIQPLTADGTATEPAFMPGLSYSLMHNYATGGLLCEIFFSHACARLSLLYAPRLVTAE